MSRRLARLLVGFAVLVLATPAVTQASPLFTNFGPSFSYDVSTGNAVGNGFDGNAYSQGDTFVPSHTAALGTIEIALSEVFTGSQAGPITVNLTGNTGTQPGAVIESFSIAPGSLGLLGNNNAPIVLTSALHPLLSLGTRYWITASLGIDSAVAWNFNSTGDLSDEAISTDGGASWFSPSSLTPGAFEVDGVAVAGVPEPGTLGLLASGVLALAGLEIRRRWQRGGRRDMGGAALQ